MKDYRGIVVTIDAYALFSDGGIGEGNFDARCNDIDTTKLPIVSALDKRNEYGDRTRLFKPTHSTNPQNPGRNALSESIFLLQFDTRAKLFFSSYVFLFILNLYKVNCRITR